MYSETRRAHTRTQTCSDYPTQPSHGPRESCFPLLGMLPTLQTSHLTTRRVPQLLSDDSMLCHPDAISG